MCRQILVKITNVKYQENRPIRVALIHADGRAEEANSYFRKRMLLKASMLNRLMVTEPKNLTVACGKFWERKTAQNSGIRFPGFSFPSILSKFESRRRSFPTST